MAGKPSPFGIDQNEIDSAIDAIDAMPCLRLVGFHIYSGTQCLKPESVAENYGIFIDLFRRASARAGVPPKKLVFGSGLGIPYYDMHTPLDLAKVAELTLPMLRQLRQEPAFESTRFALELGRYLVGEAGVYLTRVVDIKTSRGVEIAICDGGMNHHLGATGHFGSVIHRNYRMLRMTPGSDLLKSYHLVGPLCTSIDTLARNISLPELQVGDVVAILSSGAYGPTASPTGIH